MKALSKNQGIRKVAKINSTIKIDKKLDNINNIKFLSNKDEEIKKVEFKLSF